MIPIACKITNFSLYSLLITMHDAMFIVRALEQSPVYWNVALYKSWCVVQYFSPLLFQMKAIALLQQGVARRTTKR